LRLLILVAREGFLKDKCGPRAKKFEHHWYRLSRLFKFNVFVHILISGNCKGHTDRSQIKF